MRQAHTRLPTNPIADKEFAKEVERINKETKTLANAMQKARDSINKQTYHVIYLFFYLKFWKVN